MRPGTGEDHACRASSRAWRSAASSKPNPRAAADWAGSRTPTTTSCGPDWVSSRTTTTGAGACVATYRLTEPRIIALKPPSPREPRTSMEASCPAPTRTSAGAPASSWVSIARPGCCAAACSAAAARAWLVDFSTTSDTVPGIAGVAVIRGGSPGTATIRSDVARSAASRAAHSTARKDSCEPSAPAITGFPAMPSLPLPSLLCSVPRDKPGGCGRTSPRARRSRDRARGSARRG